MDREDLEPLTVETHHVDNRWNKYMIRYRRWIFVLCIVTVALAVVTAGAIAAVIGVSVAHRSSEDNSSPNQNTSNPIQNPLTNSTATSQPPSNSTHLPSAATNQPSTSTATSQHPPTSTHRPPATSPTTSKQLPPATTRQPPTPSTEPPTTLSPPASTSPPPIPYAKLRSLATAVRSNMDIFTNPCDDFFQYSCGGWLRQNPLRSGVNQLDRFLQVTISNIKSLRDSIERGDNGNVPAVRLAKKFYDSCMNIGVINGRGARPLLDLIRETGGWSVINARNGMCS